MKINLIEMEGLLRGQCIPGDLIVNETLAEYLVRQFGKLEQQLAAVVAENARCKFEISRCHQTVDEMFQHREKWVDKEWLSSIWSTSKRLMNETPATDAAIANIQAQGVDLVIAAKKHQREIMHADTFGYGAAQESLRALINQLESFAAQLRQGAAHE